MSIDIDPPEADHPRPSHDSESTAAIRFSSRTGLPVIDLDEVVTTDNVRSLEDD